MSGHLDGKVDPYFVEVRAKFEDFNRVLDNPGSNSSHIRHAYAVASGPLAVPVIAGAGFVGGALGFFGGSKCIKKQVKDNTAQDRLRDVVIPGIDDDLQNLSIVRRRYMLNIKLYG